MRICLLGLLFCAGSCFGQKGWEAEIMPGISSYSGDLTQTAIPIHTIQPSVSANLKYNTGDFINVRLGVAWGIVSGNDKYNSQWDLKGRNLSFKSDIFEGNICIELNLADPDIYYSYPYLFGGVGVFHFNPYAYDSSNHKVYLHPLSTEGEGLPQYPSVKNYSLTQICLPFGGGWKIKVHDNFTITFEAGIRYLFTDYLDDVSGKYVDRETLLLAKGQQAAQMAFRATFPITAGDPRGNPKVKDKYAFAGVKFGFYLGRKKD
ncbi:MAG TPA: DUF6089 family protein [Chitinophagaceae bacterium]|nr:DUF6089 family protein [Chitinophagaceae bacterium]